jgi:YVTN family beta-propeller protein
VKVNPALTITTFTVSPSGDLQVGSGPETANVVWSVATGPWYAVTIYSGTDSLCSGDTTVVANQHDINATQAIFSFPQPTTPSTTTFYCVTVTDSSMGTPNGATKGPVTIDITPALSTPTFSISPKEINYGQPAVTITAHVAWFGGNSPYTISIVSGSSPNCALDTTAVTVVWSTPNPTTGITATGSWLSPTSATYYCAVVDDHSGSISETVSAPQQFTIGPILAVHKPVLSSLQVDLNQATAYEGIPETATVTWSGGTGPYNVAFYSTLDPTACSAAGTLVAANPGFNPLTTVPGFTATFHFLAPAFTTNYCVTVTDTEPSVPQTVLSGQTQITVSLTTLAVPTISLSSPGIDKGQALPGGLDITVANIAGGTPPYIVTLYSGTSASDCSLDTTKVASASTNGPSYVFNVAITSAARTDYCATVSDSSEVPVTQETALPAEFTVNPVITVAPYPSFEVPAGTGATLTIPATAGGTPALKYHWYNGAGCVAANAIPGATAVTYNTGVLTMQTTYSFSVTDSSVGTPADIVCGSVTVTVNNGPDNVACVTSGPYFGLCYVTNPFYNSLTVLDSDSMSAIATIPLTSDRCTTPASVPFSPWGVAVDKANSLVYVSGSYTCTTPAGTFGGYVVVNLKTNTQVAAYQVGKGAEGIALNAALGQVYVANSIDYTVSVFHTTASGIGETQFTNSPVPVGAGPMNIAIDPNTYTVFVTDYLSNTVSIIQPRLNVSPITFSVTNALVGSAPIGVAVNPSTDKVYVANSGSGTVSVLDGITYNLIATIKIGGSPQDIAINSAGNTAYVTDLASNAVTVINLATNTPVAPAIPVGSGPFGVAVLYNPVLNPAFPSLAFVVNSGSNTVSIINIATGQVLATIVVP